MNKWEIKDLNFVRKRVNVWSDESDVPSVLSVSTWVEMRTWTDFLGEDENGFPVDQRGGCVPKHASFFFGGWRALEQFILYGTYAGAQLESTSQLWTIFLFRRSLMDSELHETVFPRCTADLPSL